MKNYFVAVAYKDGYSNAMRDINGFLTKQLKKCSDPTEALNNLVLALYYNQLFHAKGE